MLIRDEAIPLRIIPWSNTSRFVAWLARDHGKILTLIRGAQRPKSFFLGQMDLFYTCDVVFYARERHSLHTARECAPIETRSRLRSDWRACSVASYAADVMHRALQFDTPAHGCFELMEQTLDALEAGPASARWTLPWFDLHFMDTLGLKPRIRTCPGCGNAWDHVSPLIYSPSRGGFTCLSCEEGDAAADSVKTAPEIISLLVALQDRTAPPAREPPDIPRHAAGQIHGLVGNLLRYHLNLPLPSRDRAWEILNA